VTTLSPTGFLTIAAADLEYRMIGPAPADAPTIVMLHEGLGSAGLWGDFPDRLQAATGAKADPRKAYQVEAWKDLPAIKHRQVHVIQDELLNTPGPPLVQGAQELWNVLHLRDRK
jgi:pimeloyl-ACP methyl ester carboxylesterase